MKGFYDCMRYLIDAMGDFRCYVIYNTRGVMQHPGSYFFSISSTTVAMSFNGIVVLLLWYTHDT